MYCATHNEVVQLLMPDDRFERCDSYAGMDNRMKDVESTCTELLVSAHSVHQDSPSCIRHHEKIRN